MICASVFYLCKCFMIYASVFYLCKCFVPMSHRKNHSAFHEYFANKRQIKASLSLEIVKKTSRDRMQRPKKVCRPKKVSDRMLPRSTLLRNLARFPRILTSVSILIVHVLLYEEPIKVEIEMPLSQSFSRRPEPLTKSRRNSGLEIALAFESSTSMSLLRSTTTTVSHNKS